MILQKKAEVCSTIEFMEAQNIPFFKQHVFDHFRVSHRQGWAMISDGSKDCRHHRAKGEERCRRPSKVTNWHLKEMDRIMKDEGLEARKLSWQELGFEVGLEGVHARTMGNSISYSRCIACQKKWCYKRTATH
ncbi:hypothetical protein EJ02DRAFT_354942 [Clathrospora elynae]|uniref:Uncharacterized protein n=1 Tax=Clathrospora elynae TaxID=706981 RepID=A0A6A5SEH9_9PLEO|nr:hypothetical protein EJ02DRAFT_354942 [Clathrospora elynae]